MELILFAATVAAVLGSGLIAGTFFVFSVAIMPAFQRLSPGSAVSAMKEINRIIQNALFLGVFIGTAIVSAGLAIWSILNWPHPAVTYLFAGSFFYIIGSFGVTVIFNVPLNNTLDGSDAESVWNHYARTWTLWNHVRTVASILATGAFTLAAAVMV